MTDQPKFSDAEWELILELLEREMKELPAEIRHTRLSGFREKLHARLEMLEGIVNRARGTATA